MRTVLAGLVLVVLLGGCGGDNDEIWIYTSIYPHVLERMQPALDAEFPGVRIRWYQKGSEQVAIKLESELGTGGTPCDLLLTSDPFFYAELKNRGLLLPYESPAAAAVPAALRDPDHAFTTLRLPVMVLGVNVDALAEAERPRRFADLAAPAFRDLVSMGDPGKSGTNFTTVASLVRRSGWELIEGWSENGLVAAGGNSSVIRRLESRERPVGVVLLENLLPRIREGAPLAIVYPEDGAVPVPSPIAILASTDRPELARRVYDFMFSEPMQAAIVAGHMYSPLPDHPAPEGAPPLSDMKLQPWDHAFLLWVTGRRAEIQQRFRAILRR